MKKYLKLLSETKLFEGISESEIEAVLQCLSAVTETYQKGEYIFRRGEEVSRIAIVLEGEICIQKENYWGNLSILNKLSEGDVFGEVYACLGDERMLNNVVAAKKSEVLFLDVHRIFAANAASEVLRSRLVENLLSVMALKNQVLARKLEHMSQRTTREKLLSYLSEQSMKAGSASFSIPFNRQQLADFLAVDRSAMSRELCKMQDEGILLFKKNHFTLK